MYCIHLANVYSGVYPQQSAAAPAPAYGAQQYHSYASQPGVQYTPDSFYPNQAALVAASPQQQQQQQQTYASPQIDQANLAKYSQYLDILQKAYGIQLPGDLTAPQSAVTSAPTPTYANGDALYQQQMAAYQQQQLALQQQQQAYQQQLYQQQLEAQKSQSQYGMQPNPYAVEQTKQQSSYPGVQQPQQPSYPVQQPSYPVQQPQQPANPVQQPSYPVQQPQQPSYPVQQPQQPSYPVQQPQQPANPVQQPSYPVQQPQQPSYPVQQPQQPSYPVQQPQQPSYPVQQPQQPSYPVQQPQQPSNPVQQPTYPQQPQAPQTQYVMPPQQVKSNYQTAALQTTAARPHVYTYQGNGQQQGYQSSSYGNGVDEEVGGSVVSQPYAPTAAPRPQVVVPPRPVTKPAPPPTAKSQTTRPYTPPTPPQTRPSTTTAATKSTKPPKSTSGASLTQQIRKLPAVLYADSRHENTKKTETLLRDTYGLPLVTFYVDKNEKPAAIERQLQGLTAHKGLPYLFICGTFIGSETHIDNYHSNGQIPQLVEYVCGDERKKQKKTTKKTAS
ncbi:unnamed protein product [Caenorhabditis bovis]|uniref:Glutaredoxin domain-containing protein n=1 Tax=Caenorhabditis bovis TaxID=2654633 RepID=A0A8S1F6G8_9PELO|nr:unnamed protein product [Caenorhabditis bovis]